MGDLGSIPELGISSREGKVYPLQYSGLEKSRTMRKLLRVPWTERRSNQSILKEINPEYSFGRTDAEAETPILWPPDAKTHLKRPWERLKVGGEGDDRG